MAGNAYTTQGWSEYEYSVFKLGNSFKPPFYVKTLSGFYSDDDSWCFSEGDIYVVLLKLKIKSVIATVEGSFPQSQLKIPLGYDGKFYLVSGGNAGHDSGETFTMKDIVSDKTLPQSVRLANPHFHRETFRQRLKKHDCTLKLSEQTTDEYFVGKSPDGDSVFLFSLESNMSFYVMKAAVDEVKYLEFNVGNLNYAIFVANVETPIVQCWPTKEAILSPAPPVPKRLPKASDLGASTTQRKKAPPPIPLKPSSKLDTTSNRSLSNPSDESKPNSAGSRSSTNGKAPASPNRPRANFTQEGGHSAPVTSPKANTSSKIPGEDKLTDILSQVPGSKSRPCVSPKPPRAHKRWEVDSNDITTEASAKSTAHSKPSEPVHSLSEPEIFEDKQATEDRHSPVSNVSILKLQHDLGGKSSHDPPLPPPRPPTVFPPNLARSLGQAQNDNTRPVAEINEFPPPPPHLLSRAYEDDHETYNKQEVDTDEEYDRKTARKPTSPAPQSPLSAPPIQFPVSPVKSLKKGGRSSRDRSLPPPPPSRSPNLVRSLGQAQNDNTRPIAEIEEPPPPPLPLPINEKFNDAYNKQLRLGQEVDTDEEYDRKATRKPASPRPQSPLTAPPIQFPVSPVKFPKKDDEGNYLTPISSAKPNRTRLPPGFHPGAQSSSDSEKSDYEEIDSDRSDYELVEEPTDDRPSSSSLTIPHGSSSPTSPSVKKRFNLKKNLNKVLKLKASIRKKPSFESGDIADDELTEDPYADHSFDFEKKPSKKRHPPQQRRRDDPLPMPLDTESPAPVKPTPFIPTTSPGRSFMPPKLPPRRDHDSKDDIVNDSDDQSDYEQVDDDASSSAAKSPHSGLQSPSYITRHPPLERPSSTSPQNQLQPFRQHKDAPPPHPPKVGMVVPLPKEPNVQEEFPRDLCNLSVEAIAQTLRKLKIPENVVENFLEAQIDGQIFVCLDDTILDDLGVGSLHKLKIIKFKNGWRPNYQSN